MKQRHIAHLEGQLEKLIEGTFTGIFGRRLRPRDLALHLARAMEDNLRFANNDRHYPIAPDHYAIYLNLEVQQRLLKANPRIQHFLSAHLVELAHQADYRMLHTPQVKVLTDPQLAAGDIRVTSSHNAPKHHTTAAMEKVDIPQAITAPIAQLIINAGRSVPLKDTIINIGRHAGNQIVIDDATVSRHHIQLRLRDGAYILFDAESRSGTFVNGVSVKQHLLQSGDIIVIGETRMLYIVEDAHTDTEQTATIDPYI